MTNRINTPALLDGWGEQTQLNFAPELEAEIASTGIPPADMPKDGRVGVTMFDAGNSKDNLVTVVVPKKDLSKMPSQALVRIGAPKTEDGGDRREYQGIVVQGPFYEPDGLRADSSIIVTTAAQGVTFIPKYHGRVMVEVLGELVDGAMVTAKFRPLPNSPVFPLDLEETKKVLNLEGDMVLGCALGHSDLEIKIPSKNKSVLPRHLGVLGTTGGGKSTTISGLVRQFQKAGLATILIDTEGEYTHIDQPTDKQNMLNALDRRGLAPGGVENLKILHLVGRETTNPGFDKKQVFTLQFDQLSHHAVMEILDFTEPQVQRYTKAWDIAREILRELKIFPLTKEEQESLYDFDEFERGYPKTALALMYDIVSACGKQAELPANEKLTDAGEDLQFPNYWLRNQGKEQKKKFLEIIGKYKTKGDSVPSWRTIQGHLGQLLRLKIFDNNDAEPFNFKELTTPGQVFLIDLSDTDSPIIRHQQFARCGVNCREHCPAHV